MKKLVSLPLILILFVSFTAQAQNKETEKNHLSYLLMQSSFNETYEKVALLIASVNKGDTIYSWKERGTQISLSHGAKEFYSFIKVTKGGVSYILYQDQNGLFVKKDGQGEALELKNKKEFKKALAPILKYISRAENDVYKKKDKVKKKRLNKIREMKI